MKKRLVCYLLAFVVTVSQVISVGATREDQLRIEQEATNSSLNEAYAAINSLEAQKEALSAEINELDQELVNVMVTVNVLKQDIANKEKAIKDTKKDLKKAQDDKNRQYTSMKKRIQYLYEKGGDSAWFQMLLESRNLSDLLNKAEYTQKMYDYDRKNLKKFEKTVKDVKKLGIQLEAEKAELVDMEVEKEAQQASLENQLAEKRAASENYESQIATAQAQAEEYAYLLQQQTEEIARLEAERLAAEEAARKAAEEEARRQAQAAAEAEEAARRAEEARLAKEAEENARRAAVAAAQDTGTETADNTSDDIEGFGGIETVEDVVGYDETVTDDTSAGIGTETEGGMVSDTGSGTQTDVYGNVIDEGSSGTGSAVPVASTGGAGQDVVNYALQFVGNPYVWGGTDPVNGADCSGFVQSVYSHFGVALNRTSEAQMANGYSVPYSQAQPGDLICYGSHIAIYMGNGQIVHASNSAPYPAGGIKVSDNAAYRTILDVRRVI